MATKTHETHDETQSGVPQYDDGAIVTMRIGGYLGCLPFRQYPDMNEADQRALNIGRRYLAERAAQSALAKAQKEPGVNAPAFLQQFLANWVAPTGEKSEFTTVASLRADVAREYLRSAFKLGSSDADNRRIDAALMAALQHPKHSVEIARRLAAKFAEYVPPKKRSESGATESAGEVEALDLDAA